MVYFAFNKKRRLLTSVHFNYVFKNSNIVKCKEIIVLGRINGLNFSRLGISISRRNVKYAYQRNRIKRLIRENFRITQYKFIHSDFVIIIKSNLITTNLKLFKKKLENLWSHYYR